MPLRKPGGKRRAVGSVTTTTVSTVIQIRGLAFKPSFVIISRAKNLTNFTMLDDTDNIGSSTTVWTTPNSSTLYQNARSASNGQIVADGFDAVAVGTGTYTYMAYE